MLLYGECAQISVTRHGDLYLPVVQTFLFVKGGGELEKAPHHNVQDHPGNAGHLRPDVVVDQPCGCGYGLEYPDCP